MAKKVYSGGSRSGSFSAALGDIQRFFEAKIEDIDNQAGYAIFKATNAGKEKMLEVIETTTSRTGEERAARGGHPGRIDTGNMIDSVKHDIHVRGDIAHRAHIGEWGWLDDVEAYFGIQDNWEKIGAMHSIQQSYIEAREILFEELSK